MLTAALWNHTYVKYKLFNIVNIHIAFSMSIDSFSIVFRIEALKPNSVKTPDLRCFRGITSLH